jgi:hypothetical protein
MSQQTTPLGDAFASLLWTPTSTLVLLRYQRVAAETFSVMLA